MKLGSIIPLALAIALAPGIAAAKATQSKKQSVTRSATAPRHVACTKFGCFPIAPNCYPRTQLDWRGNPTGFDQIVCR